MHFRSSGYLIAARAESRGTPRGRGGRAVGSRAPDMTRISDSEKRSFSARGHSVRGASGRVGKQNRSVERHRRAAAVRRPASAALLFVTVARTHVVPAGLSETQKTSAARSSNDFSNAQRARGPSRRMKLFPPRRLYTVTRFTCKSNRTFSPMNNVTFSAYANGKKAFAHRGSPPATMRKKRASDTLDLSNCYLLLLLLLLRWRLFCRIGNRTR